MHKQSRIRKKLIAALTIESGSMIQGSLVTLKSRCGKPNCACASDSSRQHVKYYLSFSEAGKTQMTYVPRERVSEIKAAITAWKRFKKISKELARNNLEVFKREKKR